MKSMTLSKRTGLILSLLIATTCCTLGCGDKAERLDLSAEQWREDLKVRFWEARVPFGANKEFPAHTAT